MPALIRLALVVGRAGLADVRVREHAVAAVEPAVGSPDERVQRLVRVLAAPAVEQDFRPGGTSLGNATPGRGIGLHRHAVGHVVAVLVGDEHQIRRRADPHAAEAELQPADQVQTLDKDLARVVPAVAVGVFEDQNAVAALALRRTPRVFVGLGDPQPAAVVDRHGDRLMHVRLAGEKRDLENPRAPSSPRRLSRATGRRTGIDRAPGSTAPWAAAAARGGSGNRRS